MQGEMSESGEVIASTIVRKVRMYMWLVLNGTEMELFECTNVNGNKDRTN